MRIIFFGKKYEKNVEKIKKPVGGVSASQDWSQKNPLAKRIFLEKALFAETPPSSKKWVFSLKNRNSQIFSLDFSNVDV